MQSNYFTIRSAFSRNENLDNRMNNSLSITDYKDPKFEKK